MMTPALVEISRNVIASIIEVVKSADRVKVQQGYPAWVHCVQIQEPSACCLGLHGPVFAPVTRPNLLTRVSTLHSLFFMRADDMINLSGCFPSSVRNCAV
jgi:hypothetical protein